MPALIIAFLAKHADLSTNVVKALLVIMVVLVIVIVAALGFHSASSYLANERAVAVDLAQREATAAVAAKVNAASEAATREQAEIMAAGMDKLNAQKAVDDAMWAAFDQTLQEINDHADEDYAGPRILNPLPYPLPASNTAGSGRPDPRPAERAAPSSAFDDFVRADAAANRLLERATAAPTGR